MLDGKINLTSFKNASVQMVDGKKSVVIPIDDNHLFTAKNGGVYVTLLAFPTEKLKPWSHNIIRSTPKEFRNGNQLIGGFKLEE